MEEGSSTTTTTKEDVKKKGSKKWIFKLVTYLIVLGFGIYIGTYIVRQKPTWFGLPQGTAQAQAEVDALVAKVGKLMALPTDETPTVATVTDVSKIKDQPFFAGAENGDKVLIYQKAGKAILYRESNDMIIEVGAVNFNQPVASTEPQTEESPAAKPKGTTTPVPTPIPSPTQ